MTDIVERLCDIAEDVEPDNADWAAVMREAADEIKRLRAEIAKLQTEVEELQRWA